MSMLSGIKVIEFSDGLVDLGGRMLREMGAEVISVVPERGDDRPQWRTLAWHHGKTRITVPEGTDLSRWALLDDADIVLDDRRSSHTSMLDDLRGERPELIHVIARAFSEQGPYHSRPATDLTLMAMSGLMTIVGDPDKPPLRLPGEQAYALAGIQVATAALLALHVRRRTGQGQRVDVSAFQSTVLANYREAIMYEWTGRIGRRTGNQLVRGKSGVRQVWPCADGYVTWSMIDNPSMMRSMVAVMVDRQVAGELADIDWDAILVADTPQDTVDRWQSVFGRFFATLTRAELGDLSLERGWGLSVIKNLDDVRSDAHLRERNLFVPVRDETGGTQAGTQTRLPGPLFHHTTQGDAPMRVLRQPVPVTESTRWSDL